MCSRAGAPSWASARAGMSGRHADWAFLSRPLPNALSGWRRRCSWLIRCGGTILRPLTGKHYQLAEPMNHPQPLTTPQPPILIGGGGEKKTLRLVAQYADACNLFAFMGVDELQRKLDVLKAHCDDVGRELEGNREDNSDDRQPRHRRHDAGRPGCPVSILGGDWRRARHIQHAQHARN